MAEAGVTVNAIAPALIESTDRGEPAAVDRDGPPAGGEPTARPGIRASSVPWRRATKKGTAFTTPTVTGRVGAKVVISCAGKGRPTGR